MVATVSMSRGERAKRRMTRISTAAVSTTTAASPVSQPQEVVDPREPDQPEGQDGRRAAQVALGEVHDPVQAVDQAQADGHEGAEQPEDHPLDPHPHRHGEHDELDHHHDGDGHQGDDGLRRLRPSAAAADDDLLSPPYDCRSPGRTPVVGITVGGETTRCSVPDGRRR